MNKLLSATLFFLLIALVDFNTAFAQEEWIVPVDKRGKLSPFEFTDSVRKHGNEIFITNCKSCHGMPGFGDFQKTTPIPPDPATPKMQDNTDGELFFKIAEGRNPMPTFKDILSPDDIWSAIAYMRSYNKNYLQQIEKAIEKKGYTGDIFIALSYLADSKQILARITGKEPDKQAVPLENVEVKLVAVRRFGNLPLDEAKSTDINGVVKFKTPSNIPGDSLGNVRLIAMLSDKELFGNVSVDSAFTIGVATNKPSLTADRAMWNKMIKAPLWILISYFCGVAAAWGTIFYILLQLRKIFFIGKNNTVPN